MAKLLSSKKKKTGKKVTVTTNIVLPGYVQFTKDVAGFMKDNWLLFSRLFLLATAVLLLTVGALMHSQYSDLSQSTEEVSAQLSGGFLKSFVEVIALYLSVVTGSLSSDITEAQQLYMGIFFIFLWLVMVWILRKRLSGAAVTVRDGLYNAASPLISTVLVMMFGLVQLLPFGVIVTVLAALSSAGILTGIWAILGFLLAIAGFVVTLYWLTGTLFALVVVTIPGTYPWAALKSSKQIIAGSRMVMLRRVLWLGLVLLCSSLLFFVAIAIDALFGFVLSLFVVMIITAGIVALFMYASTYIYLLYRKVIDERAD